MKIKVCGMREVQNVSDLTGLKPDFMGFIFYDKSKRFVENFPKVTIPKETKKVGVFVNEGHKEILEKVRKYSLDSVQLHGNESVMYCNDLSCLLKKASEAELKKVEIIKAFSVDDTFDFEKTAFYEPYCNYFLFDTKGVNYGGNGIKFDWKILQKYQGETPYFLSGGISKKDVESIRKFFRSQKEGKCVGIDINSGFEIEPGLKNIDDIKEFKMNLR